MSAPKSFTIARADRSRRDVAFEIVDEYCEAVDVLVRDEPAEFEKYFNDNAGIWLAVSGSDDEVVGCIALRPLPHLHGGACEVKRLYVKTDWRGCGIAQQLLNELLTYATAYGYKEIYLDTKDDLQDAIRFYYRAGYKDCQRYNDNPQATVFMRRELPAEPLG
jgi:ribosomal protein S18 acetylase RimI-like enzyme